MAGAPTASENWENGFVNGPDFCESFGCAGTPSPVAFSHRRNIAAVALGSSYGLALTRDGGVLTWGAKYLGQLGNGTTDSSDVPEDVCAPGVMVGQRHLGAVTGVSAGYELSLAVQRSGRVLAWGANEWGQLGDGGTTSSDVPTYVSGVSGVKEVSAGGQRALALLRDGTVVAWGRNTEGTLGNGHLEREDPYSDVPVPVAGLSGVKQISAGCKPIWRCSKMAPSRSGVGWRTTICRNLIPEGHASLQKS